MEERLLNKLQCPACRGALDDEEDALSCGACNLRYEVVEGVPSFLPDVHLHAADTETKTQDLAEEKQFYDQMYANLKGLDDGHCVVYGYEELYNFMGDLPTGTCLDVGCGAGHHSKDLALRGFHVTGIDLSPNGIVQARRVAAAEGQEIDFVLGDIERLPFRDCSFDVVFCSLILHHFPKREKLLAEISRVCDRHFVTFEVNAYDPISFLRFNVINPTIGIKNITKNQRTVPPDKLQRELRRAGFADFSMQYVDVHHHLGRYPKSPTAKVLRAYSGLMQFMPERFRSNKFMLKARKGP